MAGDEGRVERGDVAPLLRRAVAVRHRLALVRREQVLQEERHAAERTVGHVAAGELASVVEPPVVDRVEWAIERLDPFDRRLDQLER
jgi:hypothetical protein